MQDYELDIISPEAEQTPAAEQSDVPPSSNNDALLEQLSRTQAQQVALMQQMASRITNPTKPQEQQATSSVDVREDEDGNKYIPLDKVAPIVESTVAQKVEPLLQQQRLNEERDAARTLLKQHAPDVLTSLGEDKAIDMALGLFYSPTNRGTEEQRVSSMLENLKSLPSGNPTIKAAQPSNQLGAGRSIPQEQLPANLPPKGSTIKHPPTPDQIGWESYKTAKSQYIYYMKMNEDHNLGYKFPDPRE